MAHKAPEISPEARARGLATRAAIQAIKDAERDAAEAAKAAQSERNERDFPVKCSVRIIEPKNKSRHGKYGKVVTHNEGEIGVRVNVVKSKKPSVAKKEYHPGIDAWYLPSELVRELPPK